MQLYFYTDSGLTPIISIVFTPKYSGASHPRYTLLDGFNPNPDGEENIDILIEADDLFAAVEDLEKMLNFAHEHKHAGDNAVFVFFSPDGTSDPWRAKLLGGSVLYDAGLSRRWKAGKIRATVAFTRFPAWDGPEVAVSISNMHGSGTGGVAVYNHNDGGHNNFVDIDINDIEGSLDGPARLLLTNTYNQAGKKLAIVWIGQNWTYPQGLNHILPGGTASIASNNVTTNLYEWSLSSAQVTYAAGRYFKLLARWTLTSPGGLVWTKLRLISGTATIWESGWVKDDPSFGTLIRDLCTFQLPPGMIEMDWLPELTLKLQGLTQKAPQDANLEWAQLTPIDGWCQAVAIPAKAYSERIILNAASGAFYGDNGGGASKTNVDLYGAPIHLRPGKGQRLYFLMHEETLENAPEDMSLSVKVFYRPRRKSL